MSWFNHLQPDLVLGSPITSLTPDILVQNQLKGLILDVDKTLSPFHALEVSLSQALGVSLSSNLHNFTENDKLSNN